MISRSIEVGTDRRDLLALTQVGDLRLEVVDAPVQCLGLATVAGRAVGAGQPRGARAATAPASRTNRRTAESLQPIS